MVVIDMNRWDAQNTGDGLVVFARKLKEGDFFIPLKRIGSTQLLKAGNREMVRIRSMINDCTSNADVTQAFDEVISEYVDNAKRCIPLRCVHDMHLYVLSEPRIITSDNLYRVMMAICGGYLKITSKTGYGQFITFPTQRRIIVLDENPVIEDIPKDTYVMIPQYELQTEPSDDDMLWHINKLYNLIDNIITPACKLALTARSSSSLKKIKDITFWETSDGKSYAKCIYGGYYELY